MNVAYYLTPKSQVACIPVRATMRQALERMEHHRYTAVPLLDEEGRYVGTLTEGDLLRAMRTHPGLDIEKMRISDVPLRSENRAVDATAEIDEIVQVAVDQNFVPVVDSRGVLMGIVTRRAIIEHLRKRAGLVAG